MASILEQFGLDWMKKGEEIYRSRQRSGSLAEGPLAHDFLDQLGKPLLAQLRRRPAQTAKLQELLPDLGLRLEEALPVVRRLIATKKVDVLEDDPYGGNPILKVVEQPPR